MRDKIDSNMEKLLRKCTLEDGKEEENIIEITKHRKLIKKIADECKKTGIYEREKEKIEEFKNIYKEDKTIRQIRKKK